MRGRQWLAVIGLACIAAAPTAAWAQARPYIGYVYPAGGQQGTTFQIRLGGQNLDDVNAVLVSGAGVQAKVTDYYKRLGNQEFSLMREQLKELQVAAKAATTKKAAAGTTSAPGLMEASKMDSPGMMEGPSATGTKEAEAKDTEAAKIMARIEKRLAEYVNTPASNSISSLVFVEVTMAPDAAPGPREIRLVTPRGVSNPLVFHVGQVPETARKPMISATLQVLGKEESALRKRPPEEEEVRISLPCTANGQIASGEVNRYRFEARKGQRLLLSINARSLTPYLADAVPGWFQPVLRLCDARGKEMAYCDDYRFKPDPVIFFVVPEDGTYVANVTDAIYRGREDFVYRLTVGELPFLTSIFPLGAKVGESAKVEMTGWNLDKGLLGLPPAGAGPGIHPLTASKGGFVSNRLPFALDTLPEAFDKEPNNTLSDAQKVELPIMINGRIDRPDDWDVFQFTGRAGETVVAEVFARRLESPVDSVLKLTDETGKVLAMNDDHEDAQAGVNTHDADSYLMFKLPADGTYYVHLGDVARHGGPEYTYRLRISQPIPDFALLVVPSSIALSSKGANNITVQAVRKDGFAGPITVSLKDPPDGFSMAPVTIPKDKTSTRVTLKTSLTATTQPVNLTLEGRAKIDNRDVSHDAVAAEDRMQAFLWRHLVPAQDLKALVFDPAYTPPPKRAVRMPATTTASSRPASASTQATPATSTATRPTTTSTATSQTATSTATRPVATSGPAKPKFTKQQVAGLLRQLKYLYEEGLLTDDFYDRKVAECQADQ